MLTPLTPAADRFVHSRQLHWIAGKAVASKDDAVQDVFDPSTGKVLTTVAMGGKTEVETAVHAASEAFEKWSHTNTAERAKLLRAWADLLEKNTTDLVQIESLDVGKAIVATEGFDIPFGIACIRYFADLVDGLDVSTSHVLPNMEARSFRTPYGVCGFIFPWNFPYNLLLWNIIPAIAAGNTVVVKPSEITPLSTLLVARFAHDAGIPDGVINIVVGGAAVGEALTNHPQVRRMSFTGSPQVGKMIGAACGANLVPVKLELGGKGAAVVFEDADLDLAAEQLAGAITFNTGQVCCTATRWIVQEKVHDALVGKILDRLKSTKIGPSLSRETQMGPLVSKTHYDRVSQFLEKGASGGADVLLAPKSAAPQGFDGGYYMSPSLLAGDATNVCCREEVFGPSAYVLKFRKEEDAIEQVNSLSYGLANSVWTADMKKANRVAERLVAGNNWINAHNVFAYGLPYRAVNLSGMGGGVNSPETLFDYLRAVTIARPIA